MQEAEKNVQGEARKRKGRRRWWRWLLALVLLPIVLLAFVGIALYVPAVQNIVRGKAVSFLQQKLGTPVALERFTLRFPVGVSVRGLYVEGRYGDTLVMAGELKARLSVMALFDRRIAITGLSLADSRAHLAQDADSVFNFQFIVDAFGSDTTTVEEPSAGPGWQFTVDGVSLRNIHFSTDMQPSQLKLDLRLGELDLPLKNFDTDSMRFHAGDLRVADTRITMRSAPSAPRPDTYPHVESPFGELDLRFDHAAVERLAFSMATVGAPDSLWLSVGSVHIAVNAMDTRNQRFDLRDVRVDELRYGMVASATPTAPTKVGEPPWLAYDDGFRYFVRDMDIRVDEMDIRSSAFVMHEDSIATPAEVFDPAHLVIADLNARFTNVVANNDSLHVGVEQLLGHFGAPAYPFSLTTDVFATPRALAVENTTITWDGLQTELALAAEQGSLVRAYRTPEQVPMRAALKTAVPRAQQARLFALLPPGTLPVSSVPEGFELNARVQGTLEHLDSIFVALTGDAGSALHARGRVDHVSDPGRMVFDVRFDPLTMGDGLRTIAKAYARDAPVFPASLSVRAAAQGDPLRIRADLDLRSDLVDARGKVELVGWKKDLPDAVDLELDATGIALARLLGDTAWSDADVLVRANAEGLNTRARKGTLVVRPLELSHSGADLSGAELRADVAGDSVHVKLDAESEPLSLALNVDGTWPEKGAAVEADLAIAIRRADLRLLGVVEHDLAVIGDWNGHVVADTAGRIAVDLRMDGTALESGTSRFVFEELTTAAYIANDSTSASIQSDALVLDLKANIGVDTLLTRVTEKGRSFFTKDTTHRAVEGERMDLSLDLKRNEWLAGMLVPELHALELEAFTAHYDGTEDELALRVDLPALRYDSLGVERIAIMVDAHGSELNARVSAARIAQGRYAVNGLAVDMNGSGGDLAADLRIVEEEVERYRIGLRTTEVPGGRTLHLLPELVLDGRSWTVDPANSLLITDERMTAEDFELSADGERIALRTPERALEIDLDGFRIATLANIINTPDSFPIADGRIDGLVRLPAGGAAGMMADLTIDEFELFSAELGKLDLDFTNEANERYRGKVLLTHAVNRFDAAVDMAPDNLRAMAALQLRDIGFLKPLVSGYLYELAGGLDGAMDLAKQGERTTLRGQLRFQQAKVGVVATGATYTLADETVVMNDAGMRFESFELLDSLGNVFRLDGDIRTTAEKPELDLRIRTDRFRLVSSTIEQNPQFFGDLFAMIDLQVNGPAERPKVKGELGILPGTVFSVVLPGTTVELVNAEGIVVFTDDIDAVDTLALIGDAAALRDSLEALLPGVELDLAIKVDKEAEFAIVLDPAAGDQATVSGSADLVFRYAPNAPMYLSGPFIVEHGAYTLDLYGLVKKRFELMKGGSVNWNGDPVKAEMDLRARYLSETSPYALVASNGMLESERNRLQQPLPFEVLIDIDGSMSAPNIGFGIDLDRQVRNSFPKVSNKLDQLNQQGNDEELNRQVFGLLVLNSFIQDEGSGGEPSGGIATSAARSSVNGLLTDQMNKLTGRYLKGVDVSLGVNTYDQVSGQSAYQRTSLDYRVSKRVFNDRVSFEVGGSVGVDEQNSQVSNVSNTRAAQYAILYDVTRDGRFRMRGFHENAYDLYDGEITNSGIAIMFTKDFEENERARASGRKVVEEQREREAEEQPNGVAPDVR